MKALLIHPNQEPVEILPENGHDFQLEELYRHLKCSIIQVLPISDDSIMIIDEEGKYNTPDFNVLATDIAFPVLLPNDWIAGSAIVCPSNMLR